VARRKSLPLHGLRQDRARGAGCSRGRPALTAVVQIPAALRELTRGESKVAIAGQTVGEIIDGLEEHYPGMRSCLVAGGTMRPGLQVLVDGEQRHGGLGERIDAASEIHFLQAISGGAISRSMAAARG
jgi:molybdopterin converting factor small subunit